jgi:uncharacterized membrane protein HdeD (DUF308 family)
MYQPAAARSESQSTKPPSLTVSVAFAALTVGLVAVTSVVTMAPAVVAAFGAGAVTAAIMTVAHSGHARSSSAGAFARGRLARR